MSDRSAPSNAARVLRTLRHLRPSQALAQLRHALAPVSRAPRVFSGDPPPLAVEQASVPFLPPPRHARCIGRGRDTAVRLLNREVLFHDGVDWDYEAEGPLFSYHLHHFDHARGPGLSPLARAELMLDWIDAHPRGIGWDPHPISHRVLAWGKLLLTPGALTLIHEGSGRVRGSLASQLDTLAVRLEVRLQANHLFSNLLALVFGGLLFEGPAAARWLERSDAFRAELRDQLHRDGSHEERSPMYHALLLEQVLDLLNLARARPAGVPVGLVDELVDAAARMAGALELWTHPDGEIALFSDSALGIAQRPARLADYASALGVPVVSPEPAGRLAGGGFVRLADERLHGIVSVAGPAPEHQPGHAHCDALSFELSVDGERVVTDPGVFEYVPGRRRDVARATRSHATVEVDGEEQAEIWAAHRVGGRPIVGVLDYEPGLACEAECIGWATRDVVHRRRFELSEGALLVHEVIEGAVAVRLTLPLAPGRRARLEGEPGAARSLWVGGGRSALRVTLPDAGEVRWHLEPAEAYPEFGRAVWRWCLVGESDAFRRGTWRFVPEPVSPAS